MLLLILFAVVAGAGTAITPCVLPVLPALLSASSVGGRRRPLGIILGLAITFTITIVALASIAKGVGLGAGVTRTIAVVVLIAFGFVLLIPELSARLEAPLSRLARFGPKAHARIGLLVRPRRGGRSRLRVRAVRRADPGGRDLGVRRATRSAGSVAVAIAYVIGLSAVLLVYSVVGRRALGWIRRRAGGHKVERTLGVVLLLTGVVIATNLDVRFEDFLARNTTSLPGFLTDPTRALENSSVVQKRLAELRPQSGFALRQQEASNKLVCRRSSAVSIPGVKTPSLPDLGAAPQFVGTEDWFNTPGSRPLTLSELHGHVVIVDFWTYTCINCIRTLPFIEGLYKTYHRYGLEIVGVEAPEFEFEKEASNVAAGDQSRRPHATPSSRTTTSQTWQRLQERVLAGRLFRRLAGTGTPYAVRRRRLPEGRGRRSPAPVRRRGAPAAAADDGARDHALRAARHGRDVPEPAARTGVRPSARTRGARVFAGPREATAPERVLARRRRSTSARSRSRRRGAEGSIEGGVQAQHEYLVMTSAGDVPRTGEVLLDGKPIPSKYAGADVHNGRFTIVGQRLYSLVSFPADEQAIVTVVIPHGVSAYDFTFG